LTNPSEIIAPFLFIEYKNGFFGSLPFAYTKTPSFHFLKTRRAFLTDCRAPLFFPKDLLLDKKKKIRRKTLEGEKNSAYPVDPIDIFNGQSYGKI